MLGQSVCSFCDFSCVLYFIAVPGYLDVLWVFVLCLEVFCLLGRPCLQTVLMSCVWPQLHLCTLTFCSSTPDVLL